MSLQNPKFPSKLKSTEMADETELFYTPVSKVVLFATLLVSVSDLHKGLSSFVFPVKQITQNPLMATSCGFDPRHRHHTSKARNPLKWLGLRAFLCFARLYTALLHHQICATITKILKASFLHIVLLDISIVAMARASIRSILVLRRLKLFRYRLVCIYFCSFKCR